jgi:DHA2 family multidrug resistance protein-like MFS transporter
LLPWCSAWGRRRSVEPLALVAAALAAGWRCVRRAAAAPPARPSGADAAGRPAARPLFALSAFTSMASFTTQGLAFVALPFFFQTVLHRPPVETGFLMLPWALVVAFSAPHGRAPVRAHPGRLAGRHRAGHAVRRHGRPGAAVARRVGADIAWRMALCGAGFGLFQSPNLNALMSSAPPERAGGASGVIAIARLLGQTSGAALVALCFGLAGAAGPTWALWLGAGTAAVAAVASFARLRVREVASSGR